MKTGTFDEALEIIKRRLIEERREQLAQTVKEAREEYSRVEVRQGTVDCFMLEITQ